MTSHRKTDIAARFDAAHDYEQAAFIQKQCARMLAGRICQSHLLHPPRRILEFGCGTGLLSRELVTAFPQAELHLTDLAPAMLDRVRRTLAPLPATVHLYVMDGEHPQPRDETGGGFDLITSSLCLQWFEDRAGAFRDLVALLRPGGRLMVSTLLAGSLHEWQESCEAAAIPCGVPDYPTLTQLQQDWPPGGHGQWDACPLHDPSPSARHFLKGLRMIGASLPKNGHQPTLGLRRAMRHFDSHFDHVTYQAAFGAFQKGH
ncbi:methyltransferase domain-containing protein [Parasaccharibacter sp. TMW 2.1891]|uniref:methyltransferase n=1 Tax=Acetobacteraceae TaxID=433 RepID=UPI00139D555D|nr:methyltransferase [Parasaccharibacter sp. TMW 2.1891]MCL1514277.1 methyltransferase domain-containing protein [Parasaccharibacter sp. TMW 2.1891]MUG78618.1 methyltransferase domain-containing protein [Bombella sp. ESL0380]